MIMYVVHVYPNGMDDKGIVFYLSEAADEAIEVAELSAEETGELFTVSTMRRDDPARRMIETIYTCGAK